MTSMFGVPDPIEFARIVARAPLLVRKSAAIFGRTSRAVQDHGQRPHKGGGVASPHRLMV